MLRNGGAHLALIATILLVSQTVQTWAENPRPATQPYADIEWLVGSTWVTDIKEESSTTHVENQIRWAPNHQAIEFVTEFNGQPHYNGLYAYDPVKRSIGFFYTDSEGSLTIGTVSPDPDGRTLHQDFDIMQPAGTTEHLRSTLVRDGNNAYIFTVFGRKSGDWARMFGLRYERRK